MAEALVLLRDDHTKNRLDKGVGSMPPGFMNAPARYFDFAFIHISVANLTVIILMVIVFVLAVLLPFPGGERGNQ